MKDFNVNSKILRILLSVSHNSGPYNQFFLPSLKLWPKQVRCVTLKAKLNSENITQLYDSKSNFFIFLKSIIKSIIWTDILHLHHANLLPSVILAYVLKKRIVFTLGTEYKNLKLHHKLLLRIFSKFFYKFIACSKCVEEGLKKKGYENVILIRHGINLDQCFSIKKIKRDKYSLCYAGRLTPAKNIPLLSQSILSLKNQQKITLSIAGTGSDMSKLIDLNSNFDSSNVVNILGQLTRLKALNLFSSNQFYVSLSKSDGMPIAVLEAIACGCIPILFNSRPHQELFELGLQFISIPSDSKSDVKDALLSAINLSEKEIESIRVNNNKKILDFSSTTMLERYQEIAYY
jgi:glycosyltransferase involved in cell wall biosynthesis